LLPVEAASRQALATLVDRADLVALVRWLAESAWHDAPST
jgi:hypothetical protein